MRKQIRSIAFVATLSSIGIPAAEAKQQCIAAMPSNPQGHWWSYRLIDGRKCWYEGKPMLSKSLLEWPAQAASARPASGKPASALREKSGDPLDSQAWSPTDSDTFEAMWRARVQQH
jgi:hypothetical protein